MQGLGKIGDTNNRFAVNGSSEVTRLQFRANGQPNMFSTLAGLNEPLPNRALEADLGLLVGIEENDSPGRPGTLRNDGSQSTAIRYYPMIIKDMIDKVQLVSCNVLQCHFTFDREGKPILGRMLQWSSTTSVVHQSPNL